MNDNRFFFKTLEEKYSDLLKTAVKKKYVFLIPSYKFVTPNMQNKFFYENHIFYQSDYDPSLFVSLNGRVLEHVNNSFNTFLGFKKPMKFSIEEELYQEVNIQGVSCSPSVKVIYIDNVIDESCYNTTVGQNSGNQVKKESLNQMNTKEEYLAFYANYSKTNVELKELTSLLTEITDKMINNYILIKNHTQNYAMHFQQEFNPFKQVSILYT
jgi:hypothetical protein